MLYCSCESVNDKGWPRISMLVGDAKRKYEVHLNGRDYLMKYKKGRSYQCGLLINGYPNDNNPNHKNWLLGDVFLRAYYSIYDMELN